MMFSISNQSFPPTNTTVQVLTLIPPHRMPRLKADKEPDHEPIVTTGKTPDQFIIDDSDDTYMIGSEVGIHLKMTRGLLYRK